MTLILFLSVNVISAYEINDNDLNGIDSSDSIQMDSVENTHLLSSDLANSQVNQENVKSDNDKSDSLSDKEDKKDTISDKQDKNDVSAATNTKTNKTAVNIDPKKASATGNKTGNASNQSSDNVTKNKTDFTVKNTTILRGNSVYVYLKDSNGKAVAGKKVTLTIDGKKYTKTTNKNGMVSLKFNVLWGKYTLKAHYDGDEGHYGKTTEFLLHIYKLKTALTISSTSIARGKYLYAYLKDKNGQAVAGEKVTIRFRGKNHVLTTDKNGRVALKMSFAIGKFSTKVIHYASTSYYKSTKTFTLNLYKTVTKLTIDSSSVVRGRCLYAYLKNSEGKALASRPVTINFNGIDFKKTTNKNGMVSLKISSKLGTFPTKVIFKETGYYKGATKSFKLTSYLLPSKITIDNSTLVRGKYLYFYVKNSNNNKGLANQKVDVTFGTSKYTKKTNANGRAALLIGANPAKYYVKLVYGGALSYKSASRTFTLEVLTNATAKIIAKNQTCIGEYSIRITDMKDNPLANQTIKVIATAFNRSAGSGKKITQKTIILDTDVIYSAAKDNQYMKDIASVLKSKGYKVIISGRGANAHCDDVYGKYSNACIICLFGGADAGMFVDMSAKWYQNLLTKYKNRVVLGFEVPPNKINLATCTYLKRAHDDDYSPKNFTGLAYPGTYLNEHGMDYIYGRNAKEMANNFLNYAVKGLSIGLNNTLPKLTYTFTLKTNENGFAVLSGLPSGNYTLEISYSNSTLGYIADTVKAKVEIL